MAEISYSCDETQAFNWVKDVQTVVGHLTALKIGDIEIEAQFELINPESMTEKTKVVGPLSNIYWGGGYGDPIQISAQVSTKNQQDVITLLQKEMDSNEVEFKFEIFAFDQAKGVEKYYQCFHCADETLFGLIHKSGSALDLYIDKDPSGIPSPKNFTLNITIMPAEDEAQVLHWAASVDGKLSKAWGITTGS